MVMGYTHIPTSLPPAQQHEITFSFSCLFLDLGIVEFSRNKCVSRLMENFEYLLIYLFVYRFTMASLISQYFLLPSQSLRWLALKS